MVSGRSTVCPFKFSLYRFSASITRVSNFSAGRVHFSGFKKVLYTFSLAIKQLIILIIYQQKNYCSCLSASRTSRVRTNTFSKFIGVSRIRDYRLTEHNYGRQFTCPLKLDVHTALMLHVRNIHTCT